MLLCYQLASLHLPACAKMTATYFELIWENYMFYRMILIKALISLSLAKKGRELYSSPSAANWFYGHGQTSAIFMPLITCITETTVIVTIRGFLRWKKSKVNEAHGGINLQKIEFLIELPWGKFQDSKILLRDWVEIDQKG